MRMILILPLLALAASSAQAGKGDREARTAAKLEKALAGRTAGEPQDCLNTRDADIMNVHDGVVLYRRTSKVIWRNDMRGCRVLREDDILQTRLYGTSRLCSGDIAEVIDRGGHYGKGSCVFGDFVPYRKGG